MTHVSLLDLTWYQVVAFGLAYFSAIYLLLGALTLWLTRRVLPALGHGSVLDGRADLDHRHALGAHQAGVADEGEGQRFVSQGSPGGGGDLRPDAGRFAERQD